MKNHFIIGVDEVGRGPLLGDVVVCALVFDNDILTVKQDSLSKDLSKADSVGLVENHALTALTDSKKLSDKKRETLFPIIEQTATYHKIVKISASLIDELNILQATLLGMKQAIASVIEQILQTHPNATFSVMVDGNKLPVLFDLPFYERIVCEMAVVKGDGKHACISGASVLAKVVRDRDMVELAKIYPDYGIEKHKGYPTAVHIQAIEKYGILPMHRKSFAPIKHRL
ncbi:ribonuclease HII [Faucicola mancuniensis]|uniref:ribonuclease HII n=1 Tax=Faucicola mancuniensis TaxID=1309795 RepID=UPI0028E69A5B|nr:ribonuclease HII [uncultured Moraxella sp.]